MVFELARLSDRPTHADGLIALSISGMSSDRDRAASENPSKGSALQKLHSLHAKYYNTSSTKSNISKGQACRLMNKYQLLEGPAGLKNILMFLLGKIVQYKATTLPQQQQ